MSGPRSLFDPRFGSRRTPALAAAGVTREDAPRDHRAPQPSGARERSQVALPSAAPESLLTGRHSARQC